jgi:apolipoprotein N-acyltransferase
MHFATLAREYGERGAGVVLVPAWDFGADARLAARTTSTRGIENCYSIIRA